MGSDSRASRARNQVFRSHAHASSRNSPKNITHTQAIYSRRLSHATHKPTSFPLLNLRLEGADDVRVSATLASFLVTVLVGLVVLGAMFVIVFPGGCQFEELYHLRISHWGDVITILNIRHNSVLT